MQRRERCASLFAVGDAVGVDGADAQHERGNLVAIETEQAEIFAAHYRRIFDYVFRTEAFLQRGGFARGQRGIVVGRRSCFGFAGFYDGGAIFGDAAGEGNAFGDAIEGSEDVLAHFFFVGADSELKMNVIGNDVVLGAAVDGADGYDGGIEGRIFAADDRLGGHDEFGGEDDGIFADLGARAVSAAAADGDIDGSGAGERVTGGVGDFA